MSQSSDSISIHSDSSDISDVKFNLTGWDPSEEDFHIIKQFLKQLLTGLPKSNDINLSGLTREIINLSGKVGSVLVNCDEPVVEGEDCVVTKSGGKDGEGPVKKMKVGETQSNEETKNEEKEENDSADDDNVLGICSALPFKTLPKALKNIISENITETQESTSVLLINERLEALPISVSLPMLKTTISELIKNFPNTESVFILSKALSDPNKKADIDNLDFLHDEYSILTLGGQGCRIRMHTYVCPLTCCHAESKHVHHVNIKSAD